jgi:hypothetical protein
MVKNAQNKRTPKFAFGVEKSPKLATLYVKNRFSPTWSAVMEILLLKEILG